MRLFAAIYPPAEIAAQLLARLSAVSFLPGPGSLPDHIHLTVHFIGEIDPRQLDDTIESVRRSVAGLPPPVVDISQVASWPPHGLARMAVALAKVDPEFMEARRRLIARLARNRKSKGEESFQPHFTLHRFPHGQPSPAFSHAIEPLSFRAAELRLMRSVLKPTGAEHGLVATAAFDG